MLEYIPWIMDNFVEPIRVQDGHFARPQVPGAGSTPTAEALARFARPLAD
jgi:L-alanine-DL-glutamate epimerase-like enolase superfamily enzyme